MWTLYFTHPQKWKGLDDHFCFSVSGLSLPTRQLAIGPIRFDWSLSPISVTFGRQVALTNPGQDVSLLLETSPVKLVPNHTWVELGNGGQLSFPRIKLAAQKPGIEPKTLKSKVRRSTDKTGLLEKDFARTKKSERYQWKRKVYSLTSRHHLGNWLSLTSHRKDGVIKTVKLNFLSLYVAV